jgi:hypothetical protein
MNRCTVCGALGLEQTLEPVKVKRVGTAFRASITCRECGEHASAVKRTPDEAVDAATDAMACYGRGSTLSATAAAFGRSILDAATDAYRSDVEAWQ